MTKDKVQTSSTTTDFASILECDFEKSVVAIFNNALNIATEKVEDSLAQCAGTYSPMPKEAAPSGGEDWFGVQSLNHLRKVAGGRFEGLKKMWIDAGFPMQAEIGEGDKSFQVNQKGWIRLSAWLAKRGFESRLSQEGKGVFLELRKQR